MLSRQDVFQQIPLSLALMNGHSATVGLRPLVGREANQCSQIELQKMPRCIAYTAINMPEQKYISHFHIIPYQSELKLTPEVRNQAYQIYLPLSFLQHLNGYNLHSTDPTNMLKQTYINQVYLIRLVCDFP